MSELPRLYQELAPWFPILPSSRKRFTLPFVHLPIGDEGEIFEGFLALK